MVPTADDTRHLPPPDGPRADLPPPPPSGAPIGQATRPAGGSQRPPQGPPRPPWPPEQAVRRDGPARSTAATIVAATGALLILAAAATFLAVTWDQLGLTARVAAVGSGTAAAIVGGARLRRALPAVGAVVFHLGALLLPVDALGFALQLAASRAATWTAVGLVAVVALPALAVVGRSRVLAIAGYAGLPVVATGLGLAGLVAAPVATAVAALVLVPIAAVVRDRDGGLPVVSEHAAPVIALAAVAGQLVLAAASSLAVQARGVPLVTAAEAGWVPTTWIDAALAGTLATVALATVATLRRSAVLAGGVPVLVALTAVSLLLPGDAPRLAELLPWPLLFLAIEAAVAIVRPDRPEHRPLAATATVAEVLAALALPGALWTVASGTRDLFDLLGLGRGSASGPDLVLAAVAATTATAWAVAAARRATLADGARDGAVAAAVVSLAAAVTWWRPSSLAGSALLLVLVVASIVVREGGPRGVVASTSALAAGAAAVVGAWAATASSPTWTSSAVAALVAAVAATVALVLVARTERHAAAGEGPAALVGLPATVAAVVIAGVNVQEFAGEAAALAGVVGLLAGGALLLRHQPVAGDVLRSLAVLVVVLGPDAALDLAGSVTAAPAAVLVVALIGSEVVLRGARPLLLLLAGPALVRATAGVAFAATASRSWTGAALLALATVAAAVATLRPDLRLPGSVTAVLAGVPAIALLALTPAALAWGTVGVGAAVVACGVAVRNLGIAHVGGGILTIGVWQLLALCDVDAVDAWLATPALQLWLAAVTARRAGRLSSWTADVPPLLLVVVPALLERVAGGSGWHAAAAGTLSLLAVAGGGVGRHGGPLVVGVVGLTAVVLVETLAVVAAVPTWAWLTVGGVVLLATGAWIERSGGAPVASARRLADVLAERFD